MKILNITLELFSNILLFILIFGMSATVNLDKFKIQLTNRKAILIGLTTQFIILPFLGFISVVLFGWSFHYPSAAGLTLLVVTTSPGGSYSNWWCNVFNAELALSVTMTALSTLVSVIMLPFNLLLYSRFLSKIYPTQLDVMNHVDWTSIMVALTIVIFAIFSGLLLSYYSVSRSQVLQYKANRAGNIAGILLITFSFLVSQFSGNHETSLWGQNAGFYVGVAFPIVCGLSLTTFLASKFRLEKPERMAVSIECAYQNVGIANAVAISMFQDSEMRAEALVVPIYYGLAIACILGLYCVIMWKQGWSKAPRDEKLWVVITRTYEVAIDDEEETSSTDGHHHVQHVEMNQNNNNKHKGANNTNINGVHQRSPPASPVVGIAISSEDDNVVVVEDGLKLTEIDIHHRKST